MPAKLNHRPSSQPTSMVHKKPKLAVNGKFKSIRKGTPPPKPKSQSKPHQNESRAVEFSDKSNASAKPKDIKGKAKATLVDVEDEDQLPASGLPSSFKIIAGSYEKLLYGLEGSVSAEEGSYKYTIKPIFIFPAHISCIKVVAASPTGGKWLATGSADEIIKVWDLRRRKEIGGLMHHEGSITHLEFPSRSHLLSASEDGTLCLFRARDWSVLRSLKGHKGRINSVAVHPSGKVALSVGKDRTLRMWDLMRGKGVASMKLGKEAELARWSSDGSLFVVQTQSTIDVYSTDMVLLHTINHPSRLHDLKFCKRVQGEGEVLLAAGEDKKVTVYEVSIDREKMPSVIAYMIGHTNRVKAVDTLAIALPSTSSESPPKSTTIVCTISSDGKIRLYDLAELPVEVQAELPQLNPIAEYDTKGSRLTCMTLADGEVVSSRVNGKRKRKQKDEEREDEDQDASLVEEDGSEVEDRENDEVEEEEEEGAEELEEAD